jgi:hypothetical protein
MSFQRIRAMRSAVLTVTACLKSDLWTGMLSRDQRANTALPVTRG